MLWVIAVTTDEGPLHLQLPRGRLKALYCHLSCVWFPPPWLRPTVPAVSRREWCHHHDAFLWCFYLFFFGDIQLVLCQTFDWNYGQNVQPCFFTPPHTFGRFHVLFFVSLNFSKSFLFFFFFFFFATKPHVLNDQKASLRPFWSVEKSSWLPSLWSLVNF